MAARFVFLFRTAGILAIGGTGGSLAHWVGLPMPYLTGSLAFVAAFTIFRTRKGAREVQFPPSLRMIFVAVIGTMIGATFTTDLLAVVPSLGLSMMAIVLFVVVALAGNYALFRRLGRYDRTTAIFAAMPGGLVEAVSLGEQAGGDVRILSVQHFARIVLVVMIVPLLFLLWTGEMVGSASGQSFEQDAYKTADILLILVLAATGMVLGPRLRLPAAHMVGPLVLSAVAHVTGLVDLDSPAWLLNLAQLVVGSGLGSTFAGSTGRQLIRAFSLGAVLNSPDACSGHRLCIDSCRVHAGTGRRTVHQLCAWWRDGNGFDRSEPRRESCHRSLPSSVPDIRDGPGGRGNCKKDSPAGICRARGKRRLNWSVTWGPAGFGMSWLAIHLRESRTDAFRDQFPLNFWPLLDIFQGLAVPGIALTAQTGFPDSFRHSGTKVGID